MFSIIYFKLRAIKHIYTKFFFVLGRVHAGLHSCLTMHGRAPHVTSISKFYSRTETCQERQLDTNGSMQNRMFGGYGKNNCQQRDIVWLSSVNTPLSRSGYTCREFSIGTREENLSTIIGFLVGIKRWPLRSRYNALTTQLRTR